MTQTYDCALITGASRGIGRAIAEALPSRTRLLLTARDRSALDTTAQILRARGRVVETMPADLTEPTSLAGLIAWANTAELDLLVNNAGIGHFGPFLRVERAKHVAALAVNVAAPIQLTHALLPDMLDRARSRRRRCGLVNVGSSAGFAPVPQFAVYSASKAMLFSWSTALSEELRNEPVDVLTALPGATRTSFGRSAGYAGAVPLGARDADIVADDIVAALGQRSVVVTDAALRPTELPLRLASRLVTGVLGHITARMARADD